MMVTVYKRGRALRIPAACVKSYKTNGWSCDEEMVESLQDEQNSPDFVPDDVNGETYTSDDEDAKTTNSVGLEEIPLSEMTERQIREYADSLGIEHEGLSKKAVRDAIKKHLAE